MRQAQGRRHVLLDEKDGDAVAVDRDQRLEDRRHEPRRQPQRGLVQHEQPRARHERAPDGHHLLLAARERLHRRAPALGEHGKQRVDALERRAPARPRARGEGAELEVFLHRHAAEEPAALGNERDTTLDDQVRIERAQVLAVPADRARPPSTPRGPHEAGDAIQQRALAGAVRTEQRDDLAGADGERHARQHGHVAVTGLEPPDLKHARGAPRRRRGRRRRRSDPPPPPPADHRRSSRRR